MFKFYQMTLLSFGCKIKCLMPEELPKYHKKNVKYSYYVGNGNNRNLVVEIMSKRWWWKEVSSMEDANFVWTQHRIPKLF